MTEQEWIDLGNRAFACKHFRWMPGMRAIEADPEMRQHGLAWGRAIDGLKGLEWFHAHGGCIEPVPDFRDDATKGCLLALVREAYGMPYLSPKMTTSIWRIEDEGAPMKWLIPDLEYSGYFGTEAGALVDALESAGLRAAHP